MAVQTRDTSAAERSDRVGCSSAPDSAQAGREAVLAAANGRTPAAGDLFLLLASADYDIDRLYNAAVDAAGPATVTGCTSQGSFTHAENPTSGCVAAYVAGDATSAGVCHISRDSDDIAGSARRAAQAARERAGERREHEALVLLSDGLTPDQREVARGTYAVTGAKIPFVGGAAADTLQWKRTQTFGDGHVRSDGILAVWLTSDHPLAVSVGHGWRPRGRPMLVTRTEGTIVWELDGRPALEAYLAELPYPIESKDPRFFLDVLSHPVGVPNGRGRYDVRQLHAYLPEGGGLNFNTGISENSIIQVMRGEVDSLLEGATEAAAAAGSQLEGDPQLALVFSCGSRVPLLGERIAEEARAISQRLAGAPVCGFFTYGEFARVDGSSGVHNASVAVLAL